MAEAEKKTNATVAIIEAAEHVVIEEAVSLAKQISTKNAAEIKGIVNGVSKVGLAAKDDSVSTIIENIEDGVKVVGNEIVKGAEAVIDAVEKHPELIAEGALALGIGVASLAAPGLMVGSVALVGKMAADATKETINEIVVESGSGIVKGVAKEVADQTAELAAEDAAEQAKAAALEAAKDGSKLGQDATVDVKSTGTVTTEVVVPDGLKEGDNTGKKVLTTVSGDATAIVTTANPDSPDAKPAVISTETVHTSAIATSEIKSDSKVVTEKGPSVVVITNDLTGETNTVAQEGSTAAVVETALIAEAAKGESKPASIPALDVKALAKEVAREMTEIEAAKASQAEAKAVASSAVTETESVDTMLKNAATKLEAAVKNSTAKAETKSSQSAEEPQPAKSEAVAKTSDVEKGVTAEKTVQTEADTSEEHSKGSDKGTEPISGTESKSTTLNDVEIPILVQLGVVHSGKSDEPITKPETKAEAALPQPAEKSVDIAPQESTSVVETQEVEAKPATPAKELVDSETSKNPEPKAQQDIIVTREDTEATDAIAAEVSDPSEALRVAGEHPPEKKEEAVQDIPAVVEAEPQEKKEEAVQDIPAVAAEPAVVETQPQARKEEIVQDVSTVVVPEPQETKEEPIQDVPAVGEAQPQENKEEAVQDVPAVEEAEPKSEEVSITKDIQEPQPAQPEVSATQDHVSESQPETSNIQDHVSEPQPKPQQEAPTTQIPVSEPPNTQDPVSQPKPEPQPNNTIDTGSHATTHAAVKAAHEKIAELHQSNELLHQKMDTMQEALLAITKLLAERNQTPQPASEPVSEPTPAPQRELESQPELEATEHNQVVLAAPPPEMLNKRLSIFGSIGWLFGAKPSKGHKRGKSIATSTPATVTPGGEPSGS